MIHHNHRVVPGSDLVRSVRQTQSRRISYRSERWSLTAYTIGGDIGNVLEIDATDPFQSGVPARADLLALWLRCISKQNHNLCCRRLAQWL